MFEALREELIKRACNGDEEARIWLQDEGVWTDPLTSPSKELRPNIIWVVYSDQVSEAMREHGYAIQGNFFWDEAQARERLQALNNAASQKYEAASEAERYHCDLKPCPYSITSIEVK